MQHGKSLGHRSRTFRIAMAFLAVMPLGWVQAQTATAGTLERIRTSGKIVLGYHADAQPMSYKDPSGQAAGYSVTLCRKVADDVKTELGLAKLAVEWVALAPAAGLQELQRGKIDLLCGSEAATLTQRANASFSIPIFPGGISALLRADAAQPFQRLLEERPAPYQPVWRGSTPPVLKNKTMSAVDGTAAADWLKDRAKTFRVIETVDVLDRYETGVEKVINRKSDALFGDRARLLDLAKRSVEAKKLRVLTRHFTFEPLALALARNDDDFRLFVDRSLIGLYASPKFGEVYVAAFGPADADTIQYFRGMPK